MAHHKGRPNTVELHHDELDRTIWTTPGAAEILKASGWHEPSEESPEEITDPVVTFTRPEED